MPEVIDISVPKGWSELSQKQLRYFFFMISVSRSMEEAITRCFLKWGQLKVVGRGSENEYVLCRGSRFFTLSPVELWQLMRPIYWLGGIPPQPAVVLKFGRHRAVDPMFKGVPFGKYLSCVAVWSDMMRRGAPDNDRICELVELLYGFRPKKADGVLMGVVVYWLTSLQEYFSKRFPDLFSPPSSDGQGSLGAASSSFRDSMDAMIRALTKGDVLKEKDVLACDTYRALVELDAQAKEARRIKDSVAKK